MAILSVELEEKRPGRMLIRIGTVDDVVDRQATVERTFADIQAATTYLCDWLARWQAGDRTEEV
ncbi:MAG: hypothetical protein ACR2H2_05690 [Solirubrobacteraceae bacterium]